MVESCHEISFLQVVLFSEFSLFKDSFLAGWGLASWSSSSASDQWGKMAHLNCV
jgi:hypothetical protein